MAEMTADAITKRQQYETLRAELLNERSSFESLWKDLGNYLSPFRPRFCVTERNQGDRRNRNIIDSTGSFAIRTLQSGLHAGLTSPARPWFHLTTPDPDLADFAPVKEWLHVVEQRMRTVFQQSNLYNVLPTTYGDMGVFATAAMGVLDDTEDLFRCYAYPIGSYALGLNARGLVNTFVRDYVLTVRQLVETFCRVPGTRDLNLSCLSTRVKDLWDNHKYQATVNVCWIVSPNDDVQADRLDYRRFPFISCHFEKGGDTGQVLRESGFAEFPILAPRWDVTAEDTYGTDCPGITVLGDVKALQLMTKRKAQAIEKLINPPMNASMEMKTQATSLLPGGLNFTESFERGGLKPVYEVKPDIGALTMDIQDIRYLIRRGCYEDLFLMLASSDGSRGAQPITAREIDERHEEKLLALGPVLERTNDELLNPLINRVWGLMEREGFFDEARGGIAPPRELDGVSLKVEYVSLMAQAQKLVSVSGHEHFLQSTLALAEMFPEVKYKVDIFQAIDDSADMLGVNPKLVRSNEEATASLQQAQQAQAQAQQAAQLESVAKSAKNLAAAPVTGDTALASLIQGAQAQGVAA